MTREWLVDEDCAEVRARRHELEDQKDAALDDPLHELGRSWTAQHVRWCEQCAAFNQTYGGFLEGRQRTPKMSDF